MKKFTAHICVRRNDFSGSLDVIEEEDFMTQQEAISYTIAKKRELGDPSRASWECFVNEYDLSKPQGHQRIGEGLSV
jgi:hypothetical protein